MLATATLLQAASGSVIEVGYPTRSESAGLSPTRPAVAPQDHIETVDQPNLPPVTEHRVDHKTAAALGADQPDGVLLRPDGVVWDPPPSAALEAA
jgi:hypothetical protein